MFHSYRINNSALIKNGLFREIEIRTLNKGVPKLVKTRANIETFCLLDFFCFMQNADKLKILQKGDRRYFWVNYRYVAEKNPSLFLTNEKIKRHLDILQKLDLVNVEVDFGQVFISLKNLELIHFENDKKPLNGNQESLLPTNQESLLPTNQESLLNNNKESIITNNKEYSPVLASKESKTPPASKSGLFGYQEEKDLTFSQAVEKQEDLTLQTQTKNSKFNYTPEFETFWSLYRTKQPKDKHPAFKAYLKAIKEINPDELLKILERHINYWTFENTKSSFIPYASTWLNKKRWLDELDGAFERGKAMGQYSDEIVDF